MEEGDLQPEFRRGGARKEGCRGVAGRMTRKKKVGSLNPSKKLRFVHREGKVI